MTSFQFAHCKRLPYRFALVALSFAAVALGVPAGESIRDAYKIEVTDKKDEMVDVEVAIDPTQRIRFQDRNGMMLFITDEHGRQLTRTQFPMFHIDGNVSRPLNGVGRFTTMNGPLPKTPGGKDRIGSKTVYVQGDFTITMTLELAPSKSSGGQKRQMDTVFVRYLVENTGNQDHKFGMRIFTSTNLGNNAGNLFAAPNHPNKILDGVELKDGKVPEYFQILQKPDLKDPGAVAYMTLSLGRESEKPSRVVFTRFGPAPFNQWEMPVMAAMGNSATGIFWEPKDIKAGGKREMAYAFGKGIGSTPEGECRYRLQLGGSFAPGKLFTISALIDDAAPGQTLALELPEGMERVEGKQLQPVPLPEGEHSESMVLWKGRVMHEGEYTVRVRSSNGLTQAKVVRISKS